MLVIQKQHFLTFMQKNVGLLSGLFLLALTITGLMLQPKASAETPPWPTAPPAQICDNTTVLSNGPTTAPGGAITVPAGNNEQVDFRQANTTYWFAPGIHTLGTDIYGQIIPGNNATFLGAPGAILDGQHINRFAFTQQATNVTIKYLEIRNFGPGTGNNDEGVVNHDAGANWTVEYNYVHDNDGAGVFLGTNSIVRYNCLKNNGQYGFSSYHPNGVTNVTLDHNEITGNNQDNWESLREGCGCTGGGKFWDTRGGIVTNNYVHNNRGPGLWADHNNAGFLFENNYIAENDGIGLFYEVSYNFMIKHNAFVRNALVDGKARATRGDPFPSAAIYISESGGDMRAGAQYSNAEIVGNLFEDNWDGVALWENADRFCRPGEEFDTTNGCPFFDQTWGLRYKTQNIAIHHNSFNVDRQAIECSNDFCARNAVFSNYGTHPANSPYLGTVIQDAITFSQNNTWHDNDYSGDWRYMPHDMGTLHNFATWQSNPYSQDTRSTYTNDPGAPGSQPQNPPQTPTIVNHLDTNTATLEGGSGQWTDWYSVSTNHSTEAAHSGNSSLKVTVTNPWGWGVQLANWPGFAATPGAKVLSFWGKLGAGGNAIQPKMTVKWLDDNYTVLQTDAVTLPALSQSWQHISAIVDAPVGTATALVYLTDSAAQAGNYFYLDDFTVGIAPNIVDAESSQFEDSIGAWSAWYSASVAASSEQAHGGNKSLKVTVTDPWGWAIQLANWPGFTASAGDKRIQFWAKQGAGNVNDVVLRVKWFDANQNVLQADTLHITTLSAHWQLSSVDATAPTGTASAHLELYSDSGTTDNSVYIDDISITDR